MDQVQLQDQEKAKEFIEAYNKLCDQFGLVIITEPIFISTNHGTFEIGVRSAVKKKPLPMAQ